MHSPRLAPKTLKNQHANGIHFDYAFASAGPRPPRMRRILPNAPNAPNTPNTPNVPNSAEYAEYSFGLFGLFGLFDLFGSTRFHDTDCLDNGKPILLFQKGSVFRLPRTAQNRSLFMKKDRFCAVLGSRKTDPFSLKDQFRGCHIVQ